MKDTTTNTYSDFSELRKIQGSECVCINVLGRLTINDGFGGTFYWDTTSTLPDDNINIIQKIGLATGRWIRADEFASPSIQEKVQQAINEYSIIKEDYELFTDIPKVGPNALILCDQDNSSNGDNTESQFIRQNNKLFYLVAAEQ